MEVYNETLNYYTPSGRGDEAAKGFEGERCALPTWDRVGTGMQPATKERLQRSSIGENEQINNDCAKGVTNSIEIKKSSNGATIELEDSFIFGVQGIFPLGTNR